MGLLKGLFGKRSKEPPQQSIALVMPLLPAGDVDWHAVFAHAANSSPDFPQAAPQVEGTVASVEIPGGTVAVSLMPTQVPSSDLAGPIAMAAHHWPGAESDIAQHRQHVVVVAGSQTADAIAVHLLASRAAAATLAVANGIGMYIGHAMLVRDAAGYIQDISSASRANVPVPSWIGFNPVNDEGALSAYTTGLTVFGFRELEVRRPGIPFDEAFNTLMNIASYQLETGRQLADGDTIGTSETERNKVTYAQSAFIPDMQVAIIELQGA